MSTGNASVVGWTNTSDEQEILDSVSLDEPWAAVEKLGTLVRLSGTPEEREAVDYLTGKLDEFGVPYTLHEPVCFISIPRGATVRVEEDGGKSYRAKTVAMSVSTGGQEISGELVYVPGSGGRARGIDIFSSGVNAAEVDVKGKIVISEGMAAPGTVRDAMKAGAIAGIFINPGEYIHEGICTTIWGAPDLDNMERQPAIPAINVNYPDGQELIEVARRGGHVALSTTLELDWRPIPVLVAEIKGSQVPDEFVLVHGHLDGWHFGVADNATGDASLLEMARVFNLHKDKLARTVRVAWWSGHSHGRYAGATWYADNFAIDLARNCVAQINCDSPGARWATTYDRLCCMNEAESFVDKVIRETTGITPEPSRPPRAGDYAFNQIGITSFYMLTSTMSQEKMKEENYYPVGGCGGNIQWHTEDDTMEIADRDNLLRDIKMYTASVYRTANAPLHPFDWTITTAAFRKQLEQFQEAAGSEFDFGQSFAALDELESALQRFYDNAPDADSASVPEARVFNHAQRRLGRLLVRVNFSRMPEFWHDPAVNVPPLPDLQPALTIPNVRSDEHVLNITKSHLTRGQNRLAWTLEQAREVVDAATSA
jgi:N-acetylated-alpha-linked acidic dipeptidase